jgi:predicted GIY-YIG superfamily endonuclease
MPGALSQGKSEGDAMTTTYLYRLLDNEARLLYIGISNSPIYRLFQHLEEKPWAPQIVWQNVKRFDTREEAEQAEELAIRTEKPLYNIQFNDEERANQVRDLIANNRNKLFALFEENAVPKDITLSPSNARALARERCGPLPNFSKADWQAWCSLPAAVDSFRIVSGTNV